LQTPAVHVSPFEQALKQLPQSLLDVCVSAQCAVMPPSMTPPSGMQSVCPFVHVDAHVPAVHVSRFGKHGVVQVPQCALSVCKSKHAVPPSPEGHED
jgi:hypothetical protein